MKLKNITLSERSPPSKKKNKLNIVWIHCMKFLDSVLFLLYLYNHHHIIRIMKAKCSAAWSSGLFNTRGWANGISKSWPLPHAINTKIKKRSILRNGRAFYSSQAEDHSLGDTDARSTWIVFTPDYHKKGGGLYRQRPQSYRSCQEVGLESARRMLVKQG